VPSGTTISLTRKKTRVIKPFWVHKNGLSQEFSGSPEVSTNLVLSAQDIFNPFSFALVSEQ
jgi:hypothetical protein